MKTSNEELNKWRFDHRRGPVSLRIIGDEAYAQAFIGEAKALLFSVKNALQLNQQPQGEGRETFRMEPGSGLNASLARIL